MNEHPARFVGDVASVGAMAAAFLDYAPHLAATLAIVWWLIRIYYEIRTGQRKLRRRR